MSEEEKSVTDYAAFCSGDDKRGTWLWCNVGYKIDTTKPFYADVINGGWQLWYDPMARLMKVVETKQLVPDMRLAGIGKVPRSMIKEHNGDYNAIIHHFLREGEYHSVEYFVHDRH